MAVVQMTELKEPPEPAPAFDPLTDVSADARFIVRQLTWNLVLWFLVVPLILGFFVWAVSQRP